MKYTVNQAAKIVGATRQTIYRHIESKPISVEKDENGNQLIDASELIRVYGNKINFDAATNDDSDATPEKQQNVTIGDSRGGEGSIEDKIQLVRLESEISKLSEMIRRTEEENDYIKTLLEEEKAERRKATNLLEDMREKEGRVETWEKTLKALEARIANQEQSAKTEKEERQKILRQNHALKKALETEKSKTLWQRLFG
ncbi:MAG: hypothetical protein ACK4NR_12385 [Micavibrio sp.]